MISHPWMPTMRRRPVAFHHTLQRRMMSSSTSPGTGLPKDGLALALALALAASSSHHPSPSPLRADVPLPASGLRISYYQEAGSRRVGARVRKWPRQFPGGRHGGSPCGHAGQWVRIRSVRARLRRG